MKKLLAIILSVMLASCLVTGVVTLASADTVNHISTAEQLLAINGTNGSYVLDQNITLPQGQSIPSFYGTLDGAKHTVSIDNGVGLIGSLGSEKYPKATVKNLTIEGTVSGTNKVGGVAANAMGVIDNVTVKADIASTFKQGIAGFANCNGKNSLLVKDCTFMGTVKLAQGFTSAENYIYFGIFLGYNGGAFGGGRVVNGKVVYNISIPTSEASDITAIEVFNDNDNINIFGDSDRKEIYGLLGVPEDDMYVIQGGKRVVKPLDAKKTVIPAINGYKTEGGKAVYTVESIINLNKVTLESINDEGIMANYGAPVVRFTMNEKTAEGHTVYHYIDGFDRSEAQFKTNFDVEFSKLYKYHDISYLPVKKIASEKVDSGDVADGVLGDGQEIPDVTSNYTQITINTASEFLSYYRLVNSAVPASFNNYDNGNGGHSVSILDMLAMSVKLTGDIDISDDHEFYGLGKQEFFPYRGGIDGGEYNSEGKVTKKHTINLEINAPNGYCVGLIGIASEMTRNIEVKNIIVEGSIKGRTKVGVMGYFDMVCNNYITGGNAVFEGVENHAKVEGYTAVGGLLGAVSASNDYIKVTMNDCSNSGNITLDGKGMYAGGILGVAGFRGSANITGVEINKAKNTGNVTGNNGSRYLGGIAGYISDGLSTLNDVESTTTPSGGEVCGRVAGHSGAVKMNSYQAGDISDYSVSSQADLDGLQFDGAPYSSTFGKQVDVKLVKHPSENYEVFVTFKNTSTGELVNFTQNGAQTTERQKGSVFPYYSVNLEPGSYELKMVVRNKTGYYNQAGDVVSNHSGAYTPAVTGSLTVSPAELSLNLGDVETAYTGKAVDYIAVAAAEGYSTTIPKFGATEQAHWDVEYYKGSTKLQSAPVDAGEYTVNAKVVANDPEAFKARYNYDYGKVYTAKLTIVRQITVTVTNAEMTEGGEYNLSVTAVYSDGTPFTNTSALNLSFRLRMSGAVVNKAPSQLGVGNYTVELVGPDTYDGCKVVYKSGTLTVKAADQDSTEEKVGCGGGCKSDMGSTGLVAFLTLAASAIIRKKRA